MHVEGVAFRRFVAPDAAPQLLAGDQRGAGAHQALKDLPGGGGQRQGRAAAAGLAAVEVHHQVVDLQALGLAAAAPAEGLQADQQLRQFEGLEQVVVGAGVEAVELVLQGIQGGEHEYRGLQAGFA
ncbi:Uncharacterised protein [Acinetobacter baumannii]|nr:Uncharacterised protein [Acinetobacter baumannii]